MDTESFGHKNNERAAQLAQNTTKDTISVNIGLEILENNNIVKNYIIDKWQNMWTHCAHGQFYRNIEPKVSLYIKYEDKNRKKEVTVTRLRK